MQLLDMQENIIDPPILKLVTKENNSCVCRTNMDVSALLLLPCHIEAVERARSSLETGCQNSTIKKVFQ